MYGLSLINCFTIIKSKIELKIKFISICILVNVLTNLIIMILINTHVIELINSMIVSLTLLFTIIIYICSFPFYLSLSCLTKRKVGPYESLSGTYSAILTDPISRYCLLYYMRDLHQEESMYYYRDSMRLKKYAENTKDKRLVTARVRKMIERYIGVGSENEINISDALKKEVMKEYNNPDLDETILQKIDEEIVSLIVTNCGNSFLASTYASKAKDMLRWFNAFEDMNNEQKDAVIEKIIEYYVEVKQKTASHVHTTIFTTKEETDLALLVKPKSLYSISAKKSVKSAFYHTPSFVAKTNG